MVIKNSTPWSTSDLRSLFRKSVREVDLVEKPRLPFHRRNKRYHWDILNNNRSIGPNGRARLSGDWMMIKIPILWSLETALPIKPKEELDFEQREKLARIII